MLENLSKMQEYTVSSKEKIWFEPNLLADPIENVFSLDFWSAQHRISGSAQGRGTTWFIQTAILPVAFRHYRRGGLFGKLVRDTYLFTGWANTRSYQEFKLLLYLTKQGVNVPRPVAARAIKHCCFYRADLLSEKIENSSDLISLLKKRSLTADEYKRVGAEIAKMHQANVNHTDLNIHNILLDKQGKVWLIDFDKCKQMPAAGGWQQANIDRLKRSFLKEQKQHGIHWLERDFELLLAGYRS